MTELSVSWGRDYRMHGKYEYCIFRGEELVERKGLYTSSSAAKRDGLKRVQELSEQSA